LLTGKIQDGLPPFDVPPFSTNSTSGEEVNFSGMLSDIGSGLIILPLIAILENMAIAKAFCKQYELFSFLKYFDLYSKMYS